MKVENILNELALEIGTKDGKAGYRSFVGGKMLDKTPPEHMILGDKIIAYLKANNLFPKFAKFDASTIDISRNADGSVILNPEAGVSITLDKKKVDEILK